MPRVNENQASSAVSRSRRRSTRSNVGQRRTPITVYVTSDERALLEARSTNTGLSMARLLVDGAIHPLDTSGIERESLDDAVALLRVYRRQLEGVTTNLNQIAHHANTIHEVPSDFDTVVAQVSDTINDIYDILSGVRR